VAVKPINITAEYKVILYHKKQKLLIFYPKRIKVCHCVSHLQSEQPVFKLNFLGEKISTNGSLVLITKLPIHIPK
jgi:hypothetical protein